MTERIAGVLLADFGSLQDERLKWEHATAEAQKTEDASLFLFLILL